MPQGGESAWPVLMTAAKISGNSRNSRQRWRTSRTDMIGEEAEKCSWCVVVTSRPHVSLPPALWGASEEPKTISSRPNFSPRR
jgi:hypothetical protein